MTDDANQKQPPTLLWDLLDPGWREREVERYKALAAATPAYRPLVEIGRHAAEPADKLEDEE